jgi:glutamyl-tRNA reductase
MNILLSGISFKTAPGEIREKMCFGAEEQKRAMDRILQLPDVLECLVLSTCNRTEAYVYYGDGGFDVTRLENTLCEMKGLELYFMKKYFYTFEGAGAVRHLFKVACGLDSMVLGEDQILGQVKSAHRNALDNGASSSVLNTLLRDAVAGAKKVKTHTELSRNSLSIGSLAVRNVAELLGGELGRFSAMVIGTGTIGSIVVKNLQSAGIGRLYITNRTHGKLDDLSGKYPEACIVPYEQRYSVMDGCDIIISSTSCPHYTITRDRLEASLSRDRERIFIDLAMPGDMDKSIAEIPFVRYMSIDHLKREAGKNFDRRLQEAERAEKMLDGFVLEFERWYEFKSALPVVREIEKFAEELVKEAVDIALGKLKNAGEEDRKAVKASIEGAAGKIMNKFLYGIKENGSKEEIRAYFKCIEGILRNDQIIKQDS